MTIRRRLRHKDGGLSWWESKEIALPTHFERIRKNKMASTVECGGTSEDDTTVPYCYRVAWQGQH